MASPDLIDTTEMYLKTIVEMEEDGVVPLRARIVERLGHSGPTVSQTIARMERDGLVQVRDDRRLELTPKGREIALEVMRKHRLAERLLVDVIGLDWVQAHEEACRWEHVMSVEVEGRLEALLNNPSSDPYGNPIPLVGELNLNERSLDHLAEEGQDARGVVVRIGEPIQAEPWLLQQMQERGIVPGASVVVSRSGEAYQITKRDGEGSETSLPSLHMDAAYGPHLFLEPRQ